MDEKLTIRVLGLSSSKKTLLANRGLEDGLVVGDHAKFFLTTGVVARGVIVKASPSRSIWSVYRIIDGTQVSKDKIMNIKISSALKLTEDSSRAILADDMSSSIPVMSKGRSTDRMANISSDDKDELDSMIDTQQPSFSSGSSKKTLEVFGVLSLNSLSFVTLKAEFNIPVKRGHAKDLPVFS